MPYPKRRLNSDERAIVDVHPHPFFLIGPVLWLIIAVGASFVSVSMLNGTAERAVNNLMIAAIVFGLAWLGVRYVRWRNTVFVVTNRRVISQTGVFTRGGLEIPIERVNNVGFRQTLIERLMGIGDIEIESGAEDGKQRFSDVRDPARVKHAITSMIQANRSRPNADDLDVTTQLERLEAMLDRGTLTWAEFEIQKRRLIGSGNDG